MKTQTGSSSRDSGYQHALSILAAKGVFKENPLNRDGHTSAVFDASDVDITGSQLESFKSLRRSRRFTIFPPC